MRLLLDQVLMPPSTGATGETAGGADDFARDSYRVDCALDARALAECGRKQLSLPIRERRAARAQGSWRALRALRIAL